jgi:hypothetical protein
MLFDYFAGVEASDLTLDEIDRMRPKVYNHLAGKLQRNLYIKVHDAYTYLEEGTPLMGTANAKAVYIMRNPLDVAVSFANHCSVSLDMAVKSMADKDYAFCGSNRALRNQLRQKLLTWSRHVESWANATELEVHLIRYEDMKLDPLNTFTKAVEFIGLDCSSAQIKEAVGKSDFSILREQEEKLGFKERPEKTTSFFRKGQVGDWKNHLSEEQVQKLVSDHKVTMKKFGYLDREEKLVY